MFKINVHSFIDVITNSSTEIYMWADEGSVKTVKGIIDTILKAAKSDKTADDLFDIRVKEGEEETWNGMPTDELIVEPKEGVEIDKDLAHEIEKVFNIDAGYNG